MTPISFALLAYLGFALADFLGAVISKKIGSYSAAFWTDVLGVFLLTLFIPIFGHHEQLHFPMVVLTLLLGVIGTISLIFFYEALKKGNASVLGTITGAFSAPVVLFSVVFLKESVSARQLLAILIIIVGIIVTGIDFHSIHKNDFSLKKGVGTALISMLLTAIYFTFIKIPADNIGWFWTLYFSYFPFIVIGLYMKIKKIPLHIPSIISKSSLLLLSSVVIGVIGLLSYYIGIDRGSVAIIAPIAGCSTTLFVLLAFIFLKEKVSRQQIIGIIVALAGIVGLSFLSV